MTDEHGDSESEIVWLPNHKVANMLLRVATLGALRHMAENACLDPTCDRCREQAVSAAQAVQVLPGARDAALTFFVREDPSGKHVVELHVRSRALLQRPSALSIARMVNDIEGRTKTGRTVVEVHWGADDKQDTTTQGDT